MKKKDKRIVFVPSEQCDIDFDKIVKFLCENIHHHIKD